MSALAQSNMNKVTLLMSQVLLVGLSLQAQNIAKEASDLSKMRENQKQLIISPTSHLLIAPDQREFYSAEEGISIRSGTSIRPKPNGWFRATVKESEIPDQVTLPELVKGFRVYPNPVDTEMLHVELPDEHSAVQLWDLNGRQLSVPIDNSNPVHQELDLSQLRSGLYLLQVQVDGMLYQRKILKK